MNKYLIILLLCSCYITNPLIAMDSSDLDAASFCSSEKTREALEASETYLQQVKKWPIMRLIWTLHEENRKEIDLLAENEEEYYEDNKCTDENPLGIDVGFYCERALTEKNREACNMIDDDGETLLTAFLKQPEKKGIESTIKSVLRWAPINPYKVNDKNETAAYVAEKYGYSEEFINLLTPNSAMPFEELRHCIH